MRVKNENPDKAVTFKKGTRFRSPSGRRVRQQVRRHRPQGQAQFKITYNRAGRMQPWKTKVTASEARVFVEAVETGPAVGHGRQQARSTRSSASRARTPTTCTASREKITIDKQDFQGIKAAYEFDPAAEKYVPVDPMDEARWYPTLVGLDDGRVLAVSGLDDVGPDRPGRQRDLRPEDQEVVAGAQALLPHLPRALPHEGRQALLLRLQRRVRAGRQGPRARSVGPRSRTRSTKVSTGCTDIDADRDLGLAAAAARAGPEGDDPRRRRRRRVQAGPRPARRSST